MNRNIEMSFLGRVMLLVTKKFAQKVFFNSNIRSKLFGTPTAAENRIQRRRPFKRRILLQNREREFQPDEEDDFN